MVISVNKDVITMRVLLICRVMSHWRTWMVEGPSNYSCARFWKSKDMEKDFVGWVNICNLDNSQYYLVPTLTISKQEACTSRTNRSGSIKRQDGPKLGILNVCFPSVLINYCLILCITKCLLRQIWKCFFLLLLLRVYSCINIILPFHSLWFHLHSF